jgi:hypothetical protein
VWLCLGQRNVLVKQAQQKHEHDDAMSLDTAGNA